MKKEPVVRFLGGENYYFFGVGFDDGFVIAGALTLSLMEKSGFEPGFGKDGALAPSA